VAEGVEIQLNYSRPSHSACYKSAFNVSVTFDCEHSQLLLPVKALDTPVKTANRSDSDFHGLSIDPVEYRMYTAHAAPVFLAEMVDCSVQFNTRMQC
jgi:hypothetical protein